MCVLVYVYASIFVLTFIINFLLYKCTCNNIDAYIYIYIYTFTYIHVHTYTYIHIHIRIYVYTYTHTAI